MNEIWLHVNNNDPMMGSFIPSHAGSSAMHVVGLDQIATFLAGRKECLLSDVLRAFTFELATRTWEDPSSMARDYPAVSFDALPKVAFNLTPCAVTVDCQIDFRTATVLIECCRPGACRGASQCQITREKAA